MSGSLVYIFTTGGGGCGGTRSKSLVKYLWDSKLLILN